MLIVERDPEIDALIAESRRLITSTRSLLDHLLRSKEYTEEQIKTYRETIKREKANLKKLESE